jgi:hypothetical protein
MNPRHAATAISRHGNSGGQASSEVTSLEATMSTWRFEPASFTCHGSWRIFGQPIGSGPIGATSERAIGRTPSRSPSSSKAVSRRRVVEDLADALGEKEASKRTRHVWNVRSPPRGGFRGLALEHGDSIQDANGVAALATRAPAENGEPPSEHAPRPAQDAEHAAGSSSA